MNTGGWGTCVTWVLLLATLVGALSACGQRSPTPTRPPAPTLAIRHRDVSALMLTLDDLGEGYETIEMYRLERGKGWDEETTRLSGYRAVYQGDQALFTRVLCQMESYLSVQDAQDAYRAYKETLTAEIRGNARYSSVSEGAVDALGEWSWKFNMLAGDLETFHYLFLRENVLVEIALTGFQSPEFPSQAVQQARALDNRIFGQ